MENLANIKYILNKFDRFITSSTKKETDENIALYEHWIDCKHDVEEKIKQISDLEDNGLLLRLPFKVGSTLYQPIYSRINEYKVIGLCFDIHHNKWMYEVAYEVGFEWHKTVCDFNYIGKTVFLTQAEAEQKLKEMEGE